MHTVLAETIVILRSYITSNTSIYPKLKCYNSRVKVEFKSNCLKHDKVTFNPNFVVNLFYVYELNR